MKINFGANAGSRIKLKACVNSIMYVHISSQQSE